MAPGLAVASRSKPRPFHVAARPVVRPLYVPVFAYVVLALRVPVPKGVQPAVLPSSNPGLVIRFGPYGESDVPSAELDAAGADVSASSELTGVASLVTTGALVASVTLASPVSVGSLVAGVSEVSSIVSSPIEASAPASPHSNVGTSIDADPTSVGTPGTLDSSPGVVAAGALVSLPSDVLLVDEVTAVDVDVEVGEEVDVIGVGVTFEVTGVTVVFEGGDVVVVDGAVLVDVSVVDVNDGVPDEESSEHAADKRTD